MIPDRIHGLPTEVVTMCFVAGVNGGVGVLRALEGGDPFGYANAAIIAGIFAFAMLRVDQARQEALNYD